MPIYAKCVDWEEAAAWRRILDALGDPPPE